MEKLKALIPVHLVHTISRTNTEDLPLTCSSLLEFFLSSPHFHQIVGELTDREMGLCRKSAASALEWKRKGNHEFSTGDFVNALKCYTQALRFAPITADEMDKEFVATVFVNRATCMHKLGLLKECIRDCNRAVFLFPGYAKAWYRRGKANASLGKYEDAIHDLSFALSNEGSSAGKSQIKVETEAISNNHWEEIGTSSIHSKDSENLGCFVGPCSVKLQCISTSDKGRGLTSSDNLPPASLVHCEEPYAAIILKHCRETHCHFCFKELPADSIPCSSCTISIYCSQHCQGQAGGMQTWNSQFKDSVHENQSADLERRFMCISFESKLEHDATNSSLGYIPEHVHECGGVHWPAVLPPEVVLAGRVLAKSIEKQRHSEVPIKPMEEMDLCHNYVYLAPESKLELHVYSIVLAYCLQNSYSSEFPVSGTSVSQLVLLISQVKVNSMAVTRMKSSETVGAPDLSGSGKLSDMNGSFTSNVEQVRVGQAIYAIGSLFNHSCQPNVHAYFLSRTLFIHSTELVPKGYPLELSYGPQVGQWGLNERQRLLEDQYSFKCRCSGCLKLNLSDLVIHAFRCVKPDCLGVVLDCCSSKHENKEANFLYPSGSCSLEKLLSVAEKERESVNKMANLLLRTDGNPQIGPGYCLNCGSSCDLEQLHSAAKNSLRNIKRLQEMNRMKKISNRTLSDALRSLKLLRSTMHPYNKDVAQAEDTVAEALCLNGELEPAMHHCKASVEILEKLYPSSHIAIGNELMKLASIQLSINDHASVMNTIHRASAIFSLYYGSHTSQIFPYLDDLKRAVHGLIP